MSVYSAHRFALRRIRKELEEAYKRTDWDAIKKWDDALAEQLDLAFSDENRDTKSLITEMEQIVSTYSQVVNRLSQSENNVKL